MLYEQMIPEEHSYGHQRRFAKSLVNILGVDGALQACRDNGWAGTLHMLRTEPATMWYLARF